MAWQLGRLSLAAVLAGGLCLAGRPCRAGEEGKPKPPRKDAPPKPDNKKAADKAAGQKYEPELQYLVELARVHRQFGHPEQALTVLNQAVELEKDTELKSELTQQAGEAALAMPDKSAEAAGYFQKAIELTTQDERKNLLRLWQGGAWRTAKDSPKAEDAFWTAYKGFADKRQKDDAFRQFKELLLKPERADAALAEYEKRFAEKPDNPDTQEVLRLLFSQGPKKDPKRAIPIQEKIVAARPDDLDELKSLAVLYQQAGQPEKAVPLFEQLVAKKPGEIEQLAAALAHAGKKEEAAAAVKKLLEGKEDDPKILDKAAQILDQIGLNRDALAVREKALPLIKDEKARADARFKLADKYREQKDYAKAEELLRALLKEATAAKPEADAKPEDLKAFEEQRGQSLSRAKKALIQLYEEQGKLADLTF